MAGHALLVVGRRLASVAQEAEFLEGCAAVCIDGDAYVVGGKVGTTHHASVECYHPVANEWRTLPSMSLSTSRAFCAAVAAEIHLA